MVFIGPEVTIGMPPEVVVESITTLLVPSPVIGAGDDVMPWLTDVGLSVTLSMLPCVVDAGTGVVTMMLA